MSYKYSSELDFRQQEAIDDYDASRPHNQMRDAVEEEENRLRCSGDRSALPLGVTEFAVAAELHVEYDWKQRKIYNPLWPSTFTTAWKWRHEKGQQEPVVPRQTSPPCSPFLQYVRPDEERRRLRLSRERNESRPFHMFQHELGQEYDRAMLKLELENIDPFYDMGTNIYDNLVKKWKENGLWSVKWSKFPGTTWKHEVPLERVLLDEIGVDAFDRNTLGKVYDNRQQFTPKPHGEPSATSSAYQSGKCERFLQSMENASKYDDPGYCQMMKNKNAQPEEAREEGDEAGNVDDTDSNKENDSERRPLRTPPRKRRRLLLNEPAPHVQQGFRFGDSSSPMFGNIFAGGDAASASARPPPEASNEPQAIIHVVDVRGDECGSEASTTEIWIDTPSTESVEKPTSPQPRRSQRLRAAEGSAKDAVEGQASTDAKIEEL